MKEAAILKPAAGFPEQKRSHTHGSSKPKTNPQNGTRRGAKESCELREALRSYEKVRENASSPTVQALLSALEACSRLKDLEAGMSIHSLAAETGDDLNDKASDSLVQMYVRCGSLVDALQAFERAPQASVVSWNALISGYAEAGDFDSALGIFSRMHQGSCKPNTQSFIAALKACSGLAEDEQETRVHRKPLKLGALEKALALYSFAARSNYKQELAVANTMIHTFAKCGSMAEARHVFERLRSRSAVSWNVLIFGYVEAGEPESALQMFTRMLGEGFRPNALTFVAALKACASSAMGEDPVKIGELVLKARSLETGMAIHFEAGRAGHFLDDFVANTAVDMYSKCGSLVDALRSFEGMRLQTIVSWNTLISGFVENGEPEKALRLYRRLRLDEQHLKPNSRTFVAALSACASSAASEPGRRVEGRILKVESLQLGRSIHSEARRCGVEMEIHVANTLIHMYSKCGSLGEARKIFEGIPARDLVSFNVLMFGYAESGDGDAALEIYSRMKDQGLKPSSVTYVAALKACASSGAREDDAGRARFLALGKEIHSRAAESGFEADVLVSSTLLDMYSKCRAMTFARRVFERMKTHDVVSWNAMMFGYEQSGEPELGIEFYDRMKAAGFKPDALSFTAAIKACSSCGENQTGEMKMKWLEKGREIHSEAEKSGYEMDLFLASTLVDFYSKSGSLIEARRVFDRMERHDVVSWNSLIAGYAESGEDESCLEIFELMDQEVKPNAQTYAAVLKASGGLSSLETGKKVHRRIYREGWEEDVMVASSLVDFYGKCGSMMNSEIVFGSMKSLRELVTWNALISGYAHQGNSDGVFEVFRRMILEERVHPDGITFLAALKACSHSGLVSRGKKIFQLMLEDGFRITPGIKHYTCMVDMLGRSNHLDEALKLVKTMKTQPDSSIWMTILAAAKKWKNVDVGRIAFESLVRLNPGETAAYVVMGNIYAEAGMWEEKAKIRSRAGAMAHRAPEVRDEVI